MPVHGPVANTLSAQQEPVPRSWGICSVRPALLSFRAQTPSFFKQLPLGESADGRGGRRHHEVFPLQVLLLCAPALQLHPTWPSEAGTVLSPCFIKGETVTSSPFQQPSGLRLYFQCSRAGLILVRSRSFMMQHGQGKKKKSNPLLRSGSWHVQSRTEPRQVWLGQKGENQPPTA